MEVSERNDRIYVSHRISTHTFHLWRGSDKTTLVELTADQAQRIVSDLLEFLPHTVLPDAAEQTLADVAQERDTLHPLVTWQPIETAPKDRMVLVAMIKDGVIWRVSEAQFAQIGWYSKSGHNCHWRTHWAPLPSVGAPPPARE